jgi:hypothetical protein
MVYLYASAKLHLLTNSSIAAAGIIRDSPFLEHTERDFRDTMDVNVSDNCFFLGKLLIESAGEWSLLYCTALRCQNGAAENRRKYRLHVIDSRP